MTLSGYSALVIMCSAAMSAVVVGNQEPIDHIAAFFGLTRAASAIAVCIIGGILGAECACAYLNNKKDK